MTPWCSPIIAFPGRYRKEKYRTATYGLNTHRLHWKLSPYRVWSLVYWLCIVRDRVAAAFQVFRQGCIPGDASGVDIWVHFFFPHAKQVLSHWVVIKCFFMGQYTVALSTLAGSSCPEFPMEYLYLKMLPRVNPNTFCTETKWAPFLSCWIIVAFVYSFFCLAWLNREWAFQTRWGCVHLLNKQTYSAGMPLNICRVSFTQIKQHFPRKT